MSSSIRRLPHGALGVDPRTADSGARRADRCRCRRCEPATQDGEAMTSTESPDQYAAIAAPVSRDRANCDPPLRRVPHVLQRAGRHQWARRIGSGLRGRHVLRFFAARGARRVVGVDISTAMLDQAATAPMRIRTSNTTTTTLRPCRQLACSTLSLRCSYSNTPRTGPAWTPCASGSRCISSPMGASPHPSPNSHYDPT